MTPVREVWGRHRPALVLSTLLLLALLAPAGPLGLRGRLASLYGPLALLSGPPSPAAP
ncbi:MAG: hypothetical protein HUU06_07680, partial [Planctomycetaceae bacterium]|nr:hypothetical protein [Planctomycetaceae bacterium]